MSGERYPAALLHLLAMLFLVLLAPVLTQMSQGAPAAVASTGASRDLAAMTLSPDDLEALGMPGFGQRTSAMLSVAEQAEQAAEQVGFDAETVGAGLADAGFERRYQRELGLPRRMDGASSRLQTFVASYIVEYASADGAAAGFALLEAEADRQASQDVPGTRAFGKRSEVTRLRGSAGDGEVYRALDVTIQRGDLVAGATIGVSGGQEPDLGLAEALAARLMEKIEAGEADGGPGLSNVALRIGGMGVETRSDEYGRIAGVTYPNYAETPGEFAERRGRYGDAVDVYGVGQSLPTGGPARSDDVRSLILLYRFANREAASSWLADSEARTLGSPNVIAATKVDGAETFGEESRTLALTTERSSAGVARGYSITARVGDRVVQLQLLGFPDVPLRAAEELARAQVECLEAGGCPERVTPPASLPPLAASTPFVPPADGSVAEDLCAVEPPVPGTPAVGIAAPPSATRDQAAGDAAPNIVLILTDDLDARAAGCMPNVRRLLMDEGVSFSNGFVTTPLCCPSRASILRGQYAHNHGVLSNSGADGGFPAFHALGDEEATIATLLQDAGYRTALLGKYLNRYPRSAAATYVPPGWDEWAAFVSSDEGDDEGGAYYSNYTLNEDGVLVAYGNQPEEYSTDVLAAKGIDFVERAAASGQPFFLFLAPYAPHGPATPAPRHGEAFAGAEAPRVPSFAEIDVGDKPAWVRANRELDSADVALIDDRYQRRLRTLLAVDEMVAALIETLEEQGELDNTIIVFSSDNGFHLGEHRLPLGKQSAYDESIRVPLIVRGPGIPAGVTVSKMALNIDLAPTFAELAGMAAPDFVDGRSLVPLLQGDAPAEWRRRFLVERHERKRSNGRLKAAATPAAEVADWEDDPEEREPGISPISAPPYIALRTERYLYVEYLDGERELYDLTADPYQMQNLAASADPALLAQLAAELEQLRACVAAGCRSAEARE